MKITDKKNLDKILQKEEEKDDEININEKTEIGEIFDNLDSDKINKDSKMPSIDFNTELTDNQIKCMAIVDELQHIGIFPEDSRLVTVLKRLNVSKNRGGRKEKTEIAAAARAADVMGRSQGGAAARAFSPR